MDNQDSLGQVIHHLEKRLSQLDDLAGSLTVHIGHLGLLAEGLGPIELASPRLQVAVHQVKEMQKTHRTSPARQNGFLFPSDLLRELLWFHYSEIAPKSKIEVEAEVVSVSSLPEVEAVSPLAA